MSTMPALGTRPPEDRFSVYGALAVEITAAWPFVAELLEKALSKELSLELVYRALLNRKMQLWIVFDHEEARVSGLVLTEVVEYPTFSGLNVMALWGRFTPMWMFRMRKMLKEFARQNKCSRIEARSTGRALEFLNALGFREESRFITMEV